MAAHAWFSYSAFVRSLVIDLTAAHSVVIFHSALNPKNDNHTLAQCHRIGQTKTVMVYRLVTRNACDSSYQIFTQGLFYI
jgi:chromodomain-helicase-DNA-binding protein 1